MKIRILSLALPLIALCLLAACGSDASTPTTAPKPLSVTQTNTKTAPTLALATEISPTAVRPTATTQSAPTQAPTTAPAQSSNSAGVPVGNIQDVLKKACSALKAQPNLTAHLVFTGTTGGEFLVQVSGADHAHMVNTSAESSDEMIVLPTGLYFKQDGKWAQQPVPKESIAKMATSQAAAARDLAGTFICFDTKAKQTALSAEITDVRAKLALPELVDGVPTLVYDVNVTTLRGTTRGTGEVKYWLGATDSVPHKLWLQYTNAKQQGLVEGTYNYNAVSIQSPLP